MSKKDFDNSVLKQRGRVFKPIETPVGIDQNGPKTFLRTGEMRLNFVKEDPRQKGITIQKVRSYKIRPGRQLDTETERLLRAQVYSDGFPKHPAIAAQNLNDVKSKSEVILEEILKATLATSAPAAAPVSAPSGVGNLKFEDRVKLYDELDELEQKGQLNEAKIGEVFNLKPRAAKNRLNEFEAYKKDMEKLADLEIANKAPPSVKLIEDTLNIKTSKASTKSKLYQVSPIRKMRTRSMALLIPVATTVAAAPPSSAPAPSTP